MSSQGVDLFNAGTDRLVVRERPGPFDILSVSKVRMALRCERQAFYRYVEGVTIPPRAALVLGGAVHTGIQSGLTEKVRTEGQEPPFDLLADSYDKAFRDAAHAADWRDDDPAEVKDDGYSMLRAFHAQISPDVMPLGLEWIERKLEFTIPKTDQRVLGYLDVLTDSKTLVDHKTSRKVARTVQPSRDNALQLGTYAVGLASQGMHVQAMRVHHLYPGKGKKGGGEALIPTPGSALVEPVPHLTPEQIGWWMRVMVDVGTRLREALVTGLFKAAVQGEWACSPEWCGYWDRCMSDW